MKRSSPAAQHAVAPIHRLDDACMVQIFRLLTPLPDRFNAACVCRRWQNLVSDHRMWLKVDPASHSSSSSDVFSTIEDAILAARCGDTILITSCVPLLVPNIQIDKPLSLVGGGLYPGDTVLFCTREYESALEFSASGRVSNLTIKAELGSCLLHRKGRLTIENCTLSCGEHPLEHLSCPIVTTAGSFPLKPLAKEFNCVSVIETRIQGGVTAIRTSGSLVLEEVRVMYGRAAIIFWFNVAQKHLAQPDGILSGDGV